MKYFTRIILLSITAGCISSNPERVDLFNMNGTNYLYTIESTGAQLIQEVSPYKGKELYHPDAIEGLYKEDPKCEAIKLSLDMLGGGKDRPPFELNPIIGKFKNLKYLNIETARKIKYPKTFKNLVKLEELHLELKDKDSLEVNLSIFSKLKKLTLSNANNFSHLPISIFELEHLETLVLQDFSKIDSITINQLEKLTNLRKLVIVGSNILLPKNYTPTSNLESVYLDCEINDVPNKLFEHIKIKRFGLHHNGDFDFDQIMKWKYLEVLYLDGMSSFKNNISNANLKDLTITHYNDDKMDIGIDELPKLERLSIWWSSNIDSLHNIQNSNLKYLTIQWCEHLEYIKLEDAKLQNIVQIQMWYNDRLKELPLTINGIKVNTDGI